MTTVMAERLKDCSFDLKKFLIEDMSRSFGMLVILRDEDWGLTEEQIIEKLENSIKYHSYKPDENQVSEVDYRKYLEKEYQSSKIYNEEELKKTIEILEKVKNIRKVLQEKSKLTTNEIVKNAISETLHQLNVIEEDKKLSIEFLKKRLNKSFEEFEKEYKKELEYNKKFQKEYNEKEYKISKERLEAYKEYVKEVKRLFND